MSRVALVTGAGRGIGRAIALELGRLGYRVAVHYRKSRGAAEETAQAIRSAGGEAWTLSADLTDPAGADALLGECIERAGPEGIGVLVNNVGNYVNRPVLETSLEEWRDMLDSNLSACFYTCRRAVPEMRRAGFGRIVNLGYAGAQHLIARPAIAPYTIAKTGVILLTKAIARSEAGRGITANVVAPGVIETSLSRPVGDIPAGRLGTVGEVAAGVSYFVQASDYVTGQVLEVAGGWNL